MRWTIAAGAAPVLWLAIFAQITDEFSVRPTNRDVAGSIVVAVSLLVVVLALRRWEGDRRRARESAEARRRNERRLQALVDLAHHLASVGTRVELLAAVERRASLTAGSDGAILVVHDGAMIEFPVVVGHDPALFPSRQLDGNAGGPVSRRRRAPHRAPVLLRVGRRAPGRVPPPRRLRATGASAGVGGPSPARCGRARAHVARRAGVLAGAVRLPRDDRQPVRGGRRADPIGGAHRAGAVRRRVRRDARRRRHPPRGARRVRSRRRPRGRVPQPGLDAAGGAARATGSAAA